MKLLKLAVIISLSAIAVGCCSCRRGNKSAKDNKPLVGTEWQLAQLNGASVATQDDSFTVNFDSEGKFFGRGDCNRYFGTYKASDNRKITLGNMGSTRAMCPGVDKEQELFDALSAADAYRIDGSSLMLLKDGELIAVFVAR